MDDLRQDDGAADSAELPGATATPTELAELPPDEAAERAECEGVIGRGLGTFLEVGDALLRIRDRRLYRSTHRRFEDYCRERWDMSRVRAHQLIVAADVAENLLTGVNKPETEAQVRPLSRLEPDEQAEAWELASEYAAGGQPTPAQVRAAAEVISPRPAPPPRAPRPGPTAEESWEAFFREHMIHAGSIERMGGVAVLCRRWDADRIDRSIDNCKYIINIFTQYAKEFEEALACDAGGSGPRA